MAFLDKLNDFTKNVGDKANDVIETTKLNNKISSEKAAIADLFKQIGERSYAKYAAGESVDPESAELFAAVASHSAAIREAEEKIKALKEAPAATPAEAPEAAPATTTSIVCPACGKENQPEARFCCGCGGKLEAPAQPKPQTCPNCGTAVEEGMLFCAQCGTKIG